MGVEECDCQPVKHSEIEDGNNETTHKHDSADTVSWNAVLFCRKATNEKGKTTSSHRQRLHLHRHILHKTVRRVKDQTAYKPFKVDLRSYALHLAAVPIVLLPPFPRGRFVHGSGKRWQDDSLDDVGEGRKLDAAFSKGRVWQSVLPAVTNVILVSMRVIEIPIFEWRQFDGQFMQSGLLLRFWKQIVIDA